MSFASFSNFANIHLSNEEMDDFSTLSEAELRKKYNKSSGANASKKSKQKKGQGYQTTETKPVKYKTPASKQTTETLDFQTANVPQTGKAARKRNKASNVPAQSADSNSQRHQRSQNDANGHAASTSTATNSLQNHKTQKAFLIEQFRKLSATQLREMMQNTSPAQFCENFSRRFASLNLDFQLNTKKPAEPLKYFTSNQQILRDWGDSLSMEEATRVILIMLNRLFTAQGQFNAQSNVAQLILLQVLAQQKPEAFFEACSEVIPSKFFDFNSKSIRHLVWLISQFDERPVLSLQLFLQAFVLHSSTAGSGGNAPKTSSFILSNQSKKEISTLLDDIMEELVNQQDPQIVIHQNQYVALLKFKYAHFLTLEDSDAFSTLTQFLTNYLLHKSKSTNYAQYFYLLFHMLKQTLKGGNLESQAMATTSTVDADDPIQQQRMDLLHYLSQFFERDPASCTRQWLANTQQTKSQLATSLMIINYLRKKPSLNRHARNHVKTVVETLKIDEEQLEDSHPQNVFLSTVFGLLMLGFALSCVLLLSWTLFCKELATDDSAQSVLSVPFAFVIQFCELLGFTPEQLRTTCKRAPFV